MQAESSMSAVLMEADSTSGATPEGAPEAGERTPPALAEQPKNVSFFNEHIAPIARAGREEELARWLQRAGLLPARVQCATGRADCTMRLRRARVVDRQHWHCRTCGRSRPLRTASLLSGVGCSVPAALRALLAWCEDRDHEHVALALGVKARDTLAVYERAEAAAAAAQARRRLGGLVLARLHPAAPPDRRAHTHHVLMLADTNNVPTNYYLHVLSGSGSAKADSDKLSAEVSEVCARVCERGSVVVAGAGVPRLELPGSLVTPLQRLTERCDADTAHFLQWRVWRGAATLLSAARDVCGGAGSARCAAAVQRYLHVSLYRRAHAEDGFYQHVLELLARHYTHEGAAPA